MLPVPQALHLQLQARTRQPQLVLRRRAQQIRRRRSRRNRFVTFAAWTMCATRWTTPAGFWLSSSSTLNGRFVQLSLELTCSASSVQVRSLQAHRSRCGKDRGGGEGALIVGLSSDLECSGLDVGLRVLQGRHRSGACGFALLAWNKISARSDRLRTSLSCSTSKPCRHSLSVARKIFVRTDCVLAAALQAWRAVRIDRHGHGAVQTPTRATQCCTSSSRSACATRGHADCSRQWVGMRAQVKP